MYDCHFWKIAKRYSSLQYSWTNVKCKSSGQMLSRERLPSTDYLVSKAKSFTYCLNIIHCSRLRKSSLQGSSKSLCPTSNSTKKKWQHYYTSIIYRWCVLKYQYTGNSQGSAWLFNRSFGKYIYKYVFSVICMCEWHSIGQSDHCRNMTSKLCTKVPYNMDVAHVCEKFSPLHSVLKSN